MNEIKGVVTQAIQDELGDPLKQIISRVDANHEMISSVHKVLAGDPIDNKAGHDERIRNLEAFTRRIKGIGATIGGGLVATLFAWLGNKLKGE